MPQPILADMADKALKSIIATLNPAGFYGPQVAQAKDILSARGVDYSDCLEPIA